MGKSFKNVQGGNGRVKEAKGMARNFDTYEALRNCKAGGPHKQTRGDRRDSERQAIEDSMDEYED